VSAELNLFKLCRALQNITKQFLQKAKKTSGTQTTTTVPDLRQKKTTQPFRRVNAESK
jgi:hypothetical protein